MLPQARIGDELTTVYAIRKRFAHCSQLGDARDDFGWYLDILGLPALR